MIKKTPLQERLALVLPTVSIDTIWEHDPDARFSELTKKGFCFHGENEDDWQCWQSEVRASAITGGRLVAGSAYLAGIWEKYGDHPRESNPNIGGYELQMTEEALQELALKVSTLDIAPALSLLRKEMEESYVRSMQQSHAT